MKQDDDDYLASIHCLAMSDFANKYYQNPNDLPPYTNPDHIYPPVVPNEPEVGGMPTPCMDCSELGTCISDTFCCPCKSVKNGWKNLSLRQRSIFKAVLFLIVFLVGLTIAVRTFQNDLATVPHTTGQVDQITTSQKSCCCGSVQVTVSYNFTLNGLDYHGAETNPGSERCYDEAELAEIKGHYVPGSTVTVFWARDNPNDNAISSPKDFVNPGYTTAVVLTSIIAFFSLCYMLFLMVAD